MAGTPVKTVGITREVWERVERQAARLKTKPGKVVNYLLARAFTEAPGNLPIKDGTVLP